MDAGRGVGRHDLIVLGGGLTGLALAEAVGGAGAEVLVVERAPMADQLAAPYDGRVTAVALRRAALPRARSASGSASWRRPRPIRDIVVREAFSPIRVHYDHQAVGDEPLGFIVENRVLRARPSRPSSRTCRPSRSRHRPASRSSSFDAARVDLDLGQAGRASAPLVALCEGRAVGDPRAGRHRRPALGLRPDRDRLHPAPRAGRMPGSRSSASSPTARSPGCR